MKCGILLWSVIIAILLNLFNNLPSNKSSDLFMINPHISLNPQNPQIYGAILRIHEDFYCEKSSDLAQRIYFIRSLLDLRVKSFSLSE